MDLKKLYKLINKTCLKGSYRPNLSYPCNKDGYLYSTNGHCLMAMKRNVADGYYLVDDKNLNITEIKTDLSFPDVSQVIPKDIAGYDKYTIEFPCLKSTDKYSHGCFITKDSCFIFGKNGKSIDHIVALDINYLTAFGGEEYNMWVKDKNTAVIISEYDEFTNSEWFYLVMPMRL